MRALKYITVLTACALYGCTNNNGANSSKPENKDTSVVKKEVCPCDSSVTYEERGKEVTQCFVGKSMIEISYFPNSDTTEVRRYYTTDPVWHLQEVIEIINNQYIEPNYAMYCDIKDTAELYKLTYISNEDMYVNQGVITNSVLGVEVALRKDTIRSKNINLLIPKEQFKGIIKIEKLLDITYKEKRQSRRGLIFIEAESMIKYGNLLEQYKAINKFCNKNRQPEQNK